MRRAGTNGTSSWSPRNCARTSTTTTLTCTAPLVLFTTRSLTGVYVSLTCPMLQCVTVCCSLLQCCVCVLLTCLTQAQCTFAHMHTLAHTHTHMHAHMHTYKHTKTCTSTHTHMRLRIHTYTHALAHMHIYTFTNTETHTLAHTHIQTYTRAYKHTHMRLCIHTYTHAIAQTYTWHSCDFHLAQCMLAAMTYDGVRARWMAGGMASQTQVWTILSSAPPKLRHSQKDVAT